MKSKKEIRDSIEACKKAIKIAVKNELYNHASLCKRWKEALEWVLKDDTK